jgi:hypothetical protein
MPLTEHGAYLNHMCVEKSILCIPFTFNSSIHLFMGHLMHHPKKNLSVGLYLSIKNMPLALFLT